MKLQEVPDTQESTGLYSSCILYINESNRPPPPHQDTVPYSLPFLFLGQQLFALFPLQGHPNDLHLLCSPTTHPPLPLFVPFTHYTLSSSIFPVSPHSTSQCLDPLRLVLRAMGRYESIGGAKTVRFL